MRPITYSSYDAPTVNRREIIRYMGAKELTDSQNDALDECLCEILPRLSYRVCSRRVYVTGDGKTLDLEFARTDSETLGKNLAGCDEAVIFAATVGLHMDRAIARYSRISPLKGLMMQAIGAERIESLCDAFNLAVRESVRSEGKYTRARFSPGYGDLPLKIQRDIFLALDCEKKIGLTLNESLLMSPSKSVTAIIGICQCPDNHDKEKCASCGKTDCAFRRA